MFSYQVRGGFCSNEQALIMSMQECGDYDSPNIRKEVIHNTTIITINVPESSIHKLKNLDLTLFSSKQDNILDGIISIFKD